MLSLQNILGTEGQEFLDNLLTKEVIVTEKLNASTLSFQKKHSTTADELERNLTFYKGTGSKKKEITIADRVMTTFFAAGMTYLNNMNKLIIDKIPANWVFVCKYFPSHQPSFINYSVLPKNGLVLSHIVTAGGTVIDDSEDLRTWAEMFDIAFEEPIFRGYLSDYQKEHLKAYINDNTENRDDSFSRFIITLLNPSLTHSLYQNDGFDSPIDGFVFKFISDDGVTKPVSAKLIDPYMSSIISKNKSKKNYTDNTDILLSDFTIFLSSQDLDSIILTAQSDGERYLELFYRLFNRYIKYKKEQLEDFDVDTNEIVKESIDIDFGIDIDKISNETTKRLLNENPEYKSIFKTLLGSFRAKKPETFQSIVMSPGVVRLFNAAVDKIQNKLQQHAETGNLSFDDYLSTVHNTTIMDVDKEVKKEQEETPDFEADKDIKQEFGNALSFADFKKMDSKKEHEEKDEKKLDSIEDMIKKLEDSVKDITDELHKDKKEDSGKEDKKEDKKEDSDKDEEKSDKKDEKKEEKKDDKEEDKKEEKSEESEESEDEGESEENQEEKEDEKKDEGKSDEKESGSDEGGLSSL